MRPVHVVFNPTSGSYLMSKAEQILSLLCSEGLNPQSILPNSLADAHKKIGDICEQFTKPCIIAVGGDGTINTVINSMPLGRATLGIIPLGTANVMARELGIHSIQDAVKRIAGGTVRPFSVAEAVSSAGVRRFVLMAGVGFDAAAVADVRPGEKRLFGKGAYLLSGLRQCLHWDHRTITVKSGQQEVCCNSVLLANVAHYAGPYRLAPSASLFASHLVVVPLPFSGRFQFIRFIGSVLLRGSYASPASWCEEQGPIHVSGDKLVQLDGDSFGEGPVTVRLIPAFNDLIV